ncbi:MAG: hypothetical protein KAV87_02700 [Desulfobacteraceae bacterium]|nr:hypothetical protein [Desulfobacteraceae bacterium]
MRILEIGVGGYSNPKVGGASLRMWKKFFPRSQIFGIDFFDKSSLEESRIKIFQGDQSDTAFLHDLAEKIGHIDIIIDDGSHINEHVKISFKTLFPYLKDGGFYVIEDLQTSYRPDKRGDEKNLNNPHTTMGMLKDLVDGINHKYIPGRTPTYYDSHIRSIHFYPKLVIFQKGKNS